jgi:predicted ATPase
MPTRRLQRTVDNSPKIKKYIPKEITLPTEPRIRARSIHDSIIMIYGGPGVGKTTFVNDLGRILFFSTDRGTSHLKTTPVNCNKWHDFEDAIYSLQQMKKKPNRFWDMVCVDLVSDMAMMAEEQTLIDLDAESLSDKKLAWGKGWKVYKNKINSFKDKLLAMGLGIIFIAHEDTKTVRSSVREYERTVPKMSKSAWDILIPITDLCGYCGFKVVKKGDEKNEIRIIQTVPTESLYAKDRTIREKPDKGWERLDGKKFAATFGKPSDAA